MQAFPGMWIASGAQPMSQIRRFPRLAAGYWPLLAAPLMVACAAGGSDDPFSTEDAGGLKIDLPDALPATDAGGGQAADATDPPPAAAVTAVPLYSCVPSEYTASVTIGGSQVFQLALDTGSTTLGVASSSCSTCDVTPEYTPGATATDDHQTGSSQYGTGSWSGEIYEDTVAVGPTPGAPVQFVAIDTQSQFFEPVTCDSKVGSMQGILGFGPSAAAVSGTDAFFDQLVATSHVANVFATELCDTGGTLWLGGYDPTFTTAAPQYTPLAASLVSTYYYAVDLESITVAGTSVPVSTPEFADSVVDTGTSIFILPTSAFTPLTAAITATPAFEQIFGAGQSAWFSNPDNCISLTQTKAELDAMLPPLTLVFGSGPSISVQASATESYLEAYEGLWCPSIYSMAPGPDFPLAAILGSPVLRSNIVIFDRANQRIGFAPHTACP